ncbi:type II toxin-antitoxin system RelE/ParE family toxin [Rubinisphaera sp. JC750]|uniref:type II toxin-antitoxin system RelE/ParE family toxin n=1 Tax=Rubinisphaera sp. JC750 TaxID=2898658 RepID=UPI0039657D17
MQIEFHPEASRELESSAAWYAEHSRRAALRFVAAIDHALESITRDPDRFAPCGERHRSCSDCRFPFQVIFRYDGDTLFVLAIAHSKRRPRYWKHRPEKK